VERLVDHGLYEHTAGVFRHCDGCRLECPGIRDEARCRELDRGLHDNGVGKPLGLPHESRPRIENLCRRSVESGGAGEFPAHRFVEKMPYGSVQRDQRRVGCDEHGDIRARREFCLYRVGIRFAASRDRRHPYAQCARS
jgi:hypothetical protein